MKKIIILIDIGFSKRDYQRFGIEILKGKYKVEILDFTEWFAPRYWSVYPEKIFNCEGYKKILNKKSFEDTVSEGEIINAIDIFSTSEHPSYIRNFLKQRKIPITGFQAILTLSKKSTLKEHLYKIFFLFFTPKKPVKKIMTLFKNKLKKNEDNFSYDYFLIGGKVGLNYSSGKNAKVIIKGHAFDYDIFLTPNKKKITNHLKSYAIFLDQCLPFHPTAAFMGEKSKATKEKYFPALNNFFNDFEAKTGLEVIFAAHPRSRYDLYPEYLYGRKYFMNKTPELVINSEIVLLHTSTALSFAVLYKKPIAFLTSNEIMKSYDDFRIHSFSRSMNSLMFNIDDKNNYSRIPHNNKIFCVNEKKYQEYKDNYIKFPGTAEKNLWDIFLDNIVDKT